MIQEYASKKDPSKKKYQVKVKTIEGEWVHLGYFPTKEEAQKAEASAKASGKFLNHKNQK